MDLEHEGVDAGTLTRGYAPPRRRVPAATQNASAKNRTATAGVAYKRKDGTKTRRLTANLTSETISRLERLLLVARQRGIARNEWIEAALDQAVRANFMPAMAEPGEGEGVG
jgi:hypothetical protein